MTARNIVTIALSAPLLLVACGDKDGGNGDDGTIIECAHGTSLDPEICDGFDNDCDGGVDEGLDFVSYFTDGDGDGYGDDATEVEACEAPADTVTLGGDCDDGDAALSPGEDEICDGVDNDCDGLVDDADGDVTGAGSYYVDNDGDGVGAGIAFNFCEQLSGYASVSGDCDDNNAAYTQEFTVYDDLDGDGYGDDATETTACALDANQTDVGGDCDDTESAANPGETEVCHDFIDNDCDGRASSGCEPWEGVVVATSADVTIALADAYEGFWLSGADTDGDGVNELISGSPYGGDDGYGEVLIHTRLEQGSVQASADATYSIQGDGSTTGGYYLGTSAWGMPDVDGDGYDEVLSADGYGYLSLYAGPIGASDSGSSAKVQISNAVYTWAYGDTLDSGDFDGDGKVDLVTGYQYYTSTESSQGAAYFMSDFGSAESGSASTVATATILGSSGSGYMGYSVVNGGDLFGTGVDALVACEYRGSLTYTYGGACFAFEMEDVSSTAYYYDAEFGVYASSSYAYLGTDVASGDVDGDGADDLLLGAPGSSSGYYGAAFLFYGGSSTSGGYYSYSADATFTAESYDSQFGYVLDLLDMDGDGRDDVAIGHYYNSDYYTYGGATHLFYGSVGVGTIGEYDADATIYGSSSSSYLGRELRNLGDVDGDGTEDLGVSAYGTYANLVFLGGAL